MMGLISSQNWELGLLYMWDRLPACHLIKVFKFLGNYHYSITQYYKLLKNPS